MLTVSASPRAIATAAQMADCQSVAFATGDPVTYLEFAMDIADACHETGLSTLALTSGYLRAEPRAEFLNRMDAVNINLLGFSEIFYQQAGAGHLAPVLATLNHAKHDAECWLEITLLLVPSYNNADGEIRQLATWIANELGADVPLHFRAHFRSFLGERDATGKASPGLDALSRARQIALDGGLNYVYASSSNGETIAGDVTYCPGCKQPVITREHGAILAGVQFSAPASSARCVHCGTTIAGYFGKRGQSFADEEHKMHETHEMYGTHHGLLHT